MSWHARALPKSSMQESSWEVAQTAKSGLNWGMSCWQDLASWMESVDQCSIASFLWTKEIKVSD